MSTTAHALKTLEKTEYILFAGGPLSTEAGDIISKYCQLIPNIGSTELEHVPPTISKTSPQNWKYYQWPYYPDIHLEAHDEGLFEMAVYRSANSRLLHGVFHVLPELQKWRTKDLFSKHATKDGLWGFESRTDDIIVLSNGEKINPLEMEGVIECHDLVHKAMIADQEMTECVLFVEPDWDRVDGLGEDGIFIDMTWDNVESANKLEPSYGYIQRDRIGIGSRARPFLLNDKGTLRRALVCKDYVAEISALGSDDNVGPGDSSSDVLQGDDMETFIRHVVSSVSLHLELKGDIEFFAAGLDSLQVIQMARGIARGISVGSKKSQGIHIGLQIIYGYCTIKSLSSYISDVMEGNGSESEDKVDDVQPALNHLINKYTTSLPTVEHKTYT